MAIDHALLNLAAETGAMIVRLYRWEPFCLSFGRHEPATRRYDRRRIEELALDCVRRPTGGRAVWHAHELTYAVAAPEAFAPPRDAYVRIHRLLAEALRHLGAEPVLATPPRTTPGPGAGPCFASAVGGEVLVGGRKVVGSAQLRGDGAFLQHGSVLLKNDQEVVQSVTVGWAANLQGSIPNPRSSVPTPPWSFERVAGAIRQAAGAWDVAWAEPPLEVILVRARRLLSHYLDPAWTWLR